MAGLTVADARAKALEYSRLYLSGIRDLRGHLRQTAADALAAEEAERKRLEQAREQAELEAQRRITVRQLFDRWAETELKPHVRADGTRIGRKDAGAYSRAQFERRIFPRLGSMPVAELRKADVLAILDATKSAGLLRTCNVLLSDLKQMLRFAVVREIIPFSPVEALTKRDAGGKDVERDRVLTREEVRALAAAMPRSRLSIASQHAIWIILATGCRIGELMNARWEHVDIPGSTWHLPETKNERPHKIHLSKFAARQFQELYDLRTSDRWVFPSRDGTKAVCSKSFGKQLLDRQKKDKPRLKHRSKHSSSLLLSGGSWTAHDLRRTAATLMASLGISSDVIDECLNHKIQSRVTRTYIRDRREGEQAAAFVELGTLLESLIPPSAAAAQRTRPTARKPRAKTGRQNARHPTTSRSLGVTA